MSKTKLYYESDIRDTVMILYVIYQFVCVTDPWAHTSFVHSIAPTNRFVGAATVPTVPTNHFSAKKKLNLQFKLDQNIYVSISIKDKQDH